MKPFRAALAATILCAGVTAARAEPPTQVAITQTVVTLTAATDTALNLDPFDKSLCLQNIGAHDATLAFNGTAAVAGQGWDLSSTAGANAKCWDSGTVPSGIVHGISTSGTTIVVLEGR